MERALVEVRKRLIELMREDPPFHLSPDGDGPVLDRWVATRLSQEELALLANLESLFGEDALAELFADALIEAGVVRASRN